MHIYFSGIGGVGVGPLAEIAHDAGYMVSGSDAQANPMTDQLRSRGIEIAIGQDGTHIRNRHSEDPIDWFVYTSSLPPDHAELAFAERHKIRISKRDELLAHIIDEKSLQLIAVAGTHGKTTTTAMLVWMFHKLGMPVSYSIGTTVGFGPSGHYDPESQYFVYECDEYDRNFLHFHPNITVLTSVDYDHPDTFPTLEDYKAAFLKFAHQSQKVICWPEAGAYLGLREGFWLQHPEAGATKKISLTGEHNRANAALAIKVMQNITEDNFERLAGHMSGFPGTGRRFEKLADNLYSDYGHHPAEIAATLQMAHELNDHVVLVYQPHQNRRQHELREQYTDCMQLADRIYWLPTYLTREDPNLETLSPLTLTENLTNRKDVVMAEMNDSLWQALKRERYDGKLVVVMGAGSIDSWLRDQLKKDS